MSRRKQAKPRSLKRDEEWDDSDVKNTLNDSKEDNEMAVIKPEFAGEELEEEEEEEEEEDEEDNDEDEEDEEELHRAFSPHSEDYLQNGRSSSVHGADLENQNSLDSDALGTGSTSWQSEEGGGSARRGGGETPSSCATPTSASFPSEPEADADGAVNADGNNPTAPYPCQFCDRTFPRLSYLKKHEQSHGDQMPYRCSWCARLFKHKRSRDRHVKLHTGDRRYRCTHCEAAFSRSDHLKIHMKTHDTQKPYQCSACSRGYNTAAALTSHMQSHKRHHHHRHHQHQQQQQQQSPSQSSHSKLQDMEYGRRSVSSHSTSSPPVPSSPSPSLNTCTKSGGNLKTRCQSVANYATSTTPTLNSPLKLACMYCTRDSFSCMQQLQMHVHTMHQAILSGENTSVAPSPGRMIEQAFCARNKVSEQADGSTREAEAKEEREGRSNDKERCESPFSCGQCTMKFSTLSGLQNHVLSIHRTDSLSSAALMMCPLCGIPCASAAAYAEHYVLQHCENRRINQADGREYADPMAGLRMNGAYGSNGSPIRRDKDSSGQEPADLTRKSIHAKATESNGYSAGTLLCGQCGAALKDFESFREHLARHLQADHRNETPGHVCPKCEARFQDREDMLAHLTKHYIGQISKEYTCGACRKMYPHPDLLQRHLLDSHAHHLYRCALCRDTFDSRVAIQVHFAVKHSQECRLYHCNACTTSNNENSPENSPGEGRSFFRSEAEMANHVRSVHAPSTVLRSSPVVTSPASTPGMAGSARPRCVFCGISCNSELELQLHLASHSTSLYRCPICREGFAVEFLLDRHIAQMHHDGERATTDRSDSRENGRIHRPSRTQDEHQAKSHKRGRSPASSNNNSLNQRDNNKRTNYGAVSGGQQCELCESGDFATEAELQAHKKLAHGQTKVPSKPVPSLSMSCAYCGEVCRSRSELETHTRIQHASNEPGGRHKCNICDEVCPSAATLAEHKLQKHCKIQLGDTCVVCRENLSTESKFLEHVQRHSLENVDPQQKLDSSLPHLPAPCVVCRQTLISDLECRLHASYHLRQSTAARTSSLSPVAKKLQNPNCCLCLRDCSSEDFVNLTSSQTFAGQSLKVCKSCYLRHNQGLPILNSPYEHVRAAKSECAWPSGKEACPWNGPVDRWDCERGSATDTDGKKRSSEYPVKLEEASDAESQKVAENESSGTRRTSTYTCIQCQMSFPSEAKVQKHVKEEHLEPSGKTSLECLRCHLCLFEASTPLQLQSHLIEHTFAGCTALSCYICQALFTVPIGLQNHMLQEHGLGARPYDCGKCALKFFFRAELDHHMLTFHHPLDDAAATAKPSEATERKPQDASNANCNEKTIPVKEEIVRNGAEEDEGDLNTEEEIVEGTQQKDLTIKHQSNADLNSRENEEYNSEQV